jgi:hypothetical protein
MPLALPLRALAWLHPASISLTKLQPASTSLSKCHLASTSLTQPHPVSSGQSVDGPIYAKFEEPIEIRNTGICACGTKEHY